MTGTSEMSRQETKFMDKLVQAYPEDRDLVLATAQLLARLREQQQTAPTPQTKSGDPAAKQPATDSDRKQAIEALLAAKPDDESTWTAGMGDHAKTTLEGSCIGRSLYEGGEAGLVQRRWEVIWEATKQRRVGLDSWLGAATDALAAGLDRDDPEARMARLIDDKVCELADVITSACARLAPDLAQVKPTGDLEPVAARLRAKLAEAKS